MELTLLQWLKSIYDATVVEQHDPKCNCEKQYGPVDRAGVAVQFGFDGFAKLAVQREDNRQLKFPDFAESLNSYFSWDEDTFRGRLPTDILPEYLRFLAGIDSGLKVEAVAWREPVLFVTSPEFNHGASEVTIELDNSFEPIREPFGLYPIRVSMEGEVQVAEPERYQERGFF